MLKDISGLEKAPASRIRRTAVRRSPPARTVRVRNLQSARYELVDDLVVTLESEGGQTLACAYDVGQYGHGFSVADALHHLGTVIEEYYDLLQEDQDRLSPPLAAHLRYLRSILRERRP